LFKDPEARVRYYACEALYNLTKVLRGHVLVFFNEIFSGLCSVRFSLSWYALISFSEQRLNPISGVRGR
jgi:hypothetical protein